MRIGQASSSRKRNPVAVLLDGLPVCLPPSRRTLTAIGSYLETLALEQQRLVCALTVDGEPVSPTRPLSDRHSFSRVEARTVGLDDLPLQLLESVRQQTAAVRARVEAAVALVLINPAARAREFWWEMARQLKEPLLTLCLLPDLPCGPAPGRASLAQLHKWQLQQLAAIIRDVDETCGGADSLALSNALENRVLRWLDHLEEQITLWQQTLSAEARQATAGRA